MNVPTNMKIRIVIADDHRIVREGLVSLLEREPDIEVLAQAVDGKELVQLARKHDPDVVLVDIAMPNMNGLEAMRRLRAESMRCKVICLCAHAEPQQVAAALEAGANGYVLKENSFDELARGVRRVMSNQLFISGELLGDLVQGKWLQGSGSGGGADSGASAIAALRSPLSPREREVVQLFSEGYTAQQIATRLYLSAKTVATHREHIYTKLNIHGMAELTRYALREGISTLDLPSPGRGELS